MPLKVQKKDGQLQDFDRSKIVNGVVRSGANPQEADNVAQQIEAWAQTAAVSGVIKSSDLRMKVLEVLKMVNPIAGTAFETYQKSVVPPTEGVPPVSEPPVAGEPPMAPPASMPPVA